MQEVSCCNGAAGKEAFGLHAEGHQDHSGQAGAHRCLRHPCPHGLLLPRHLRCEIRHVTVPLHCHIDSQPCSHDLTLPSQLSCESWHVNKPAQYHTTRPPFH